MRDQAYIDVCHTSPDFAGYGFDLVQVKHDGQWALVTVRNGLAVLTSRKGNALARLAVRGVSDCVLVGEYMAGTDRAMTDPMKGGVYVYDFLELRGEDLRERPYSLRLAVIHDYIPVPGMLSHSLVAPVGAAYGIRHAATMWAQDVIAGGAEGLIYRRDRDPYAGAVIGREKAVQTYELSFTGRFTDAGIPVFDGGVQQAVKAGLCQVERLAMMAKVAEYTGRIAEFSALARFASGKLRNPMFLKWRNDK
jgi:hypothetical protein